MFCRYSLLYVIIIYLFSSHPHFYGKNTIAIDESVKNRIYFMILHNLFRLLVNSWVCQASEEYRTKFIITGRNEVVAKVMFLHVSVILFTGGVSGQGELPQAGRTPWAGRNPPPDQADPPKPPPRPGRPPQIRQTPPPGRHPPRPGRHPPREAESGIRSTSGRYASYWNAFLSECIIAFIWI